MVHEDRLWRNRDGSIGGVVYGSLPNKSNSRRLGRTWSGRPILRKEKAAEEFEERFAVVVLASQHALGQGLPLVGATNTREYVIGVRVFRFRAAVYGDFKRDLDCELLPDLLQKNGLINNDRAIRKKLYEWYPDADHPRVEFEIGFM